MSCETEQQNGVQRDWDFARSVTMLEKAMEALGRSYSVNTLGKLSDTAISVLDAAFKEYDLPQPIIDLANDVAMLERALAEIYNGNLNAYDARWLGEEFPRLTSLLDQVTELTVNHAKERK